MSRTTPSSPSASRASSPSGSAASPDLLRAAGFVTGWAAHAADREIAALPELWKRFEDVGRFWPKR